MSAGIESGFPFNAFYNAVSLIKLFKKKRRKASSRAEGGRGEKKGDTPGLSFLYPWAHFVKSTAAC